MAATVLWVTSREPLISRLLGRRTGLPLVWIPSRDEHPAALALHRRRLVRHVHVGNHTGYVLTGRGERHARQLPSKAA